MTEPHDESAAKPSANPANPARMRLVVYLVVLALVAGVGWYLLDQRRVAEEHRRIATELMPAGEYVQAATELEALMDRAGFLIHDEMHRTLSQAYLGAGDDPGTSLVEAARWYRKAEAIDPTLIDEGREEVIRAGESRSGRGN